MVPNWKQLMIFASNWGSYLVCPFYRCGILFYISAYVRYMVHDRYIFVVLEDSLSLKCGTLLTLRLGPIIHTMVVTNGAVFWSEFRGTHTTHRFRVYYSLMSSL